MLHDRIIEVIADHAGVDTEKVTPLATLAGDLDLDSLDRIELAMVLDDQFDIDLMEAEYENPNAGTVAGLVELVTDKVQARGDKFAEFNARTKAHYGRPQSTPFLDWAQREGTQLGTITHSSLGPLLPPGETGPIPRVPMQTLIDAAKQAKETGLRAGVPRFAHEIPPMAPFDQLDAIYNQLQAPPSLAVQMRLAEQADATADRMLRAAFEAGWNACAALTPEPSDLEWDPADDTAWQRYRASL